MEKRPKRFHIALFLLTLVIFSLLLFGCQKTLVGKGGQTPTEITTLRTFSSSVAPAGGNLVVTLTVVPGTEVTDFVIQETVPSGWTILSVNEDGAPLVNDVSVGIVNNEIRIVRLSPLKTSYAFNYTLSVPNTIGVTGLFSGTYDYGYGSGTSATSASGTITTQTIAIGAVATPTPPTPAPSPIDLTSNLVGKWRFEDNLEDSATNNLDGTFVGAAAPSFVAGKIGRALRLDGTDDYLSLGSSEQLKIYNAFTWAGWVYPTRSTPSDCESGSSAAEFDIIFNKEGEYNLARNNCDGKLSWGLGGNYITAAGDLYWNFVKTEVVLPLNAWSHVALIYGNGKGGIYLNGVEVYTINTPPYAGTPGVPTPSITDEDSSFNELRFGARSRADPGKNFKGSLDQIYLYSRALSADEISLLASCFNQFTCDRVEEVAGLVAVDAEQSPLYSASLEFGNALNVNNIEGDAPGEAKDIAELQRPTKVVALGNAEDPLQENDIVFFFRHNRDLYHVIISDLSDDAQFTGSLSLQVIRSLDGEEIGEPLQLSLDEQHPLIFPAEQVALDFNNDAAPDAYLQAFGYFDRNKRLGLFLAASPTLDLNQHLSGKASLAPADAEHQQKVLFNGAYVMAASQLAGDYAFALGTDQKPEGEGYTISCEPNIQGDPTQPQECSIDPDIGSSQQNLKHFFDEGRAKATSVTPLGAYGDFVVVEVSRAPVGLEQTYEETITCKKTFNEERTTSGDFVSLYKVCADDIQKNDEVLICDGGETVRFSLSLGKPYQSDASSDLVFFYEKPPASATADKEVKIFHLFDLENSNSFQTDALYFTKNLAAGKRLLLKATDYYLLSQKNAPQDSLQLQGDNGLVLTLLSGSQPQFLAIGDEEAVRFNLPIGKQFSLKRVSTGEYEITYGASVTPKLNLAQQLQATLDTYGGVEVSDDGTSTIGQISVATTDSKSSRESVRLTYGTNKILELPWRTPTVLAEKPTVLPEKVSINCRSASSTIVGFTCYPAIQSEAQALLYFRDFKASGGTKPEETIFTKYVDAYLYYDLNNNKAHPFTDGYCMQPWMQGKKLALGDGEQYYLLKYAKPWEQARQEGFRYSELRLEQPWKSGWTASQELVPEVVGNSILFTVGDKVIRLSIEAEKVGDTQKVVFDKTSKQAAQQEAVIKEASLMENFETALTSREPVKVLDPAIAGTTSVGIISIHARDYLRDEQQMRISYAVSKDLELFFRHPVVLEDVSVQKAFTSPLLSTGGKVLAYYSGFTPGSLNDPTVTKTTNLYLLFDLTADLAQVEYPYTNELFTQPLLAGKKLALAFDGKYYLLKHLGGSLLSGLQLSTLDGTKTYTGKVQEKVVTFELGQGKKITLAFDTQLQKVTFTSTTASEAAVG